MLRLALLFLVIAVIAFLLGFWEVAGLTMNIAWILLVVFVVLAVIFFIANAMRGTGPRNPI